MQYSFLSKRFSSDKFSDRCHLDKRFTAVELLFMTLLGLTPFFSTYLNSETVSIDRKSPKEQTIFFDLPTQSLNSCLVEFAIQANVTLIVPHEIIKGYKSSPLFGRYPTRLALVNILSKSPLTFKYNEAYDSFIIEEKPQTTVEASALQIAAPEPLEEIIVRSSQFPFRYNTLQASSQLHSGISTYDYSRSINVIPNSVIVDQQPSELIELLSNSSAIAPGEGLAESNDDFFIRGFPRHALFIDGFRLESKTGIKIHPSLIDRVEILKGPSTLLYGQAEPGGVVNIIRKKPLQNFEHKIKLANGSGDENLVSIDSSGPLIEDKLLYRFVATNESQSKLRNLNDIDKKIFSSSLSWNMTDNSVIDIAYDKYKNSQIREQGTILIFPRIEGANISADSELPAQLGQPNFESDYNLLSVGYTQYFANSWILNAKYFKQKESRQGVRTQQDTLLSSGILSSAADLEPEYSVATINGIRVRIPAGTSIEDQNTTYFATVLSIFDESAENSAEQFKSVFEGSPTLFDKTHHISIGVDYRKQKIDELYVLEERSDIDYLTLSNTDIDGGYSRKFLEDLGVGTLIFREQELTYSDSGIYIQDNIELGEKWIGTIGSRYTVTQGEYVNPVDANSINLETFENISSQLGAVFKPSETISLFLNYSEAMQANYQIDDIGTIIDKPELSNQLELGTKLFLFNGNFLATAAVFSIEKENIVDVIFVDGLRNALLSGEQHVTGFDFDFTYQAGHKLDILGSFSFITPEIVTGQNAGNRPALTPRNTANLFVNYKLPLGLTINAGAYHIGQRFSNPENTSLLEEFTRIDSGISLKYPQADPRITFRVNVKNIFDQDYELSAEQGLRVNPAERRSYHASVHWIF